MDENTKAAAAAEDEDWGIDLSDVDVIDGDEEADDSAEDAALSGEAADRQAGPEDGTDTDGQTEQTDQFTLKHLGETKTVSKNEVITLAQKGMDYDRIHQKYDELTTAHGALTEERQKYNEKLMAIDETARQSGFRDADDLIDNVRASLISQRTGMDKGVALERIRFDRERAELIDKVQAQNSPQETARRAEEKRQSDFLEFVGEYSNVKPEEVPREVWETYAKGGCTLVQAYTKYENAQLKAQLEADKKSAENRGRSTGSRVSAGRNAKMDTEDELWYSDSE